MGRKKKEIDIDEDMSQTFIAEVGQKSAIADDDDNDTTEVKKEEDNSLDNNDKEDITEDNKSVILKSSDNKKQISIFTIILVIVALFVGAIISYIIFDINSKKEETSTKKVEVSEKKKKIVKEEYNPESLFIQNLISNYDYESTSSNTNIYEVLYDKKKTTIDDIDNTYLRVLAANKASGLSGTFSADDFSNAVILLYGDSVTFKDNDIKYNAGCVDIKYSNNFYKYEQGECGGTSILSMERKVVKAETSDDDSLLVYVAVAIVDLENDKVYENYNNDEDELKEIKDISAATFDIDKDYTKLNQYKYTFKYDKNNNNYYLVSIELANK